MSNLRESHYPTLLEAGLDEAGRGCLAGPVVAAAVILPAFADHPLLNDSKKLSEKNRMLLRQWVVENALAWAVGHASPKEIDEINILQASFLAMHRALDQLDISPQHLLVDGNRFKPYRTIPYQCVIGCDAIFRSIAAASIMAKTERDLIMAKLHNLHLHYNWKKNKGYPTREHTLAVAKHGQSPFHRLTFNATIQLELSL